jgi:hypothetical protein
MGAKTNLRLVKSVCENLRDRLAPLEPKLADPAMPVPTRYEYLTWRHNDDAWVVLQTPMGPSHVAGSLNISVYIGLRFETLEEIYARYLDVPPSRAFAHIYCALFEVDTACERQLHISMANRHEVVEKLAGHIRTVVVGGIGEVASLHQVVAVLEGNLKPWHGNRGYLLPLVHILLRDWKSAIVVAKQENDKASSGAANPFYREAYSSFLAKLMSDYEREL